MIGKLGQDYREYKGYLTDSIVYAVDHRSASAEGEGVANFILEENLNRIWNYITIRDMGKRKGEMPGAQAEYVLDLGDGSRIMFWGAPAGEERESRIPDRGVRKDGRLSLHL